MSASPSTASESVQGQAALFWVPSPRNCCFDVRDFKGATPIGGVHEDALGRLELVGSTRCVA